MVVRIKELPITVANQIAAGEVIERPASVVKELLENAYDAKADTIHVDIGFGGLNQIKVSDNGLGIVADDLPLAIAPHATSKISQLNDLYMIHSMGFRGEALASIASVSRLSITSKTAEQAHAMQLTAENGILQINPCARSQGTTVDVKDLFFNAPVRKKFLKGERQEFQAIELLIKRFALSAPHLAIHLTHNGKKHVDLPAAKDEQGALWRIRKILGKEFVEQAVYVDVEHAGVRLRGWVGKADYQRNQNDKQWVYINGRMVKDKLIHHAIKLAYEPVLYPGKHPACLLYLTLNPADIDINVHPTKHEIRFQQPRFIHDFLVSQLQKVLDRRESPGIDLSNALGRKNPVPPLQEKIPVFLTSAAMPAATTPCSMLAIDEQFMVFQSARGQVYLADWRALYREWLLKQLAVQPLPLAFRPLLVPVRYQYEKIMDNLQRQRYSQLLGQIGIRVEWFNESQILVQTLPLLTPHLAISDFFSRLLNAPMPTESELIHLLTASQKLPDLNSSAHGDFKDFLHHQAETLAAETLFCKPLSTLFCRELLHA
ncbi:DNA mismatch repair endonuclease MutL [Legionella taurinensis]|uniref:DNA mismatch repair protein MutL n=1 Tax=Legionella taurinensis TaxID=70611 RepID=A0AB38N1W1_9GAMM|nr:DNA mismatch repair endonuclease MutL [Legionella taurinensis]MDX1838680.1 DNA mismatch repair endonuclease MutL [Legionella taurinensis]PUT38813.1 DNA mismatch repair endonuclease MutL [Legionella taurinensis]PUT40189.1 DNA mismatch repair endonuclease MutL [Legionella taurinensis]PUT42495.1 DNA mismatch repair endonuclease MutL [Legionella taurinensis]PUT45915.1 DNA mismatch repair endonuclease MutL [Legionella taurinensis]